MRRLPFMTDDEFKKLWDRASADVDVADIEEVLAKKAEDALLHEWTELDEWAASELNMFRELGETDAVLKARIREMMRAHKL